MTPPAAPSPRHVLVTSADSASAPSQPSLLDLLLASDLATRLVAAMLRNRRGSDALSLMDPAGPRAASSTDDDRPTKAASMRDMREGQAYMPAAGRAKDRHSFRDGVGGYFFLFFSLVSSFASFASSALTAPEAGGLDFVRNVSRRVRSSEATLSTESVGGGPEDVEGTTAISSSKSRSSYSIAEERRDEVAEPYVRAMGHAGERPTRDEPPPPRPDPPGGADIFAAPPPPSPTRVLLPLL